jgi:hypothetical protein
MSNMSCFIKCSRCGYLQRRGDAMNGEKCPGCRGRARAKKPKRYTSVIEVVEALSGKHSKMARDLRRLFKSPEHARAVDRLIARSGVPDSYEALGRSFASRSDSAYVIKTAHESHRTLWPRDFADLRKRALALRRAEKRGK